MTATATKAETCDTTRKTCSVGAVESLSATSDGAEPCCDQQGEKGDCCETAIRERAYLLWERAGYPEGNGENFWYEAKEQLAAE